MAQWIHCRLFALPHVFHLANYLDLGMRPMRSRPSRPRLIIDNHVFPIHTRGSQPGVVREVCSVRLAHGEMAVQDYLLGHVCVQSFGLVCGLMDLHQVCL